MKWSSATTKHEILVGGRWVRSQRGDSPLFSNYEVRLLHKQKVGPHMGRSDVELRDVVGITGIPS